MRSVESDVRQAMSESGTSMLNLDSASSSDLTQLLGGNRPTLLLGSGISLWEPTNLPTGQDFTKGVLGAVFDPSMGAPISDPADETLLDELLASLPFEMLLERCPNLHTIGSIIATLYGDAEPNDLHKALAAMATDGAVASIITTNYDLALDTALYDSGAPLKKVVLESQDPQVPDRIYFKVHGSTDCSGSLVYSIRLESRLPVWKRSVLSRCIDNRPLVIIGYSGLDFEICPEVSRLTPSVIAWNYLTPTDMNKPGPHYLTKHGKTPEPLVGNMSRLLDLFGYSVPPLTRSTVATNVADLVRQHFAEEELLLWRVRLLNTMGFCRLAVDTLKPLRSMGHSGADLEYAQALFQLGAYRSSGSEFLEVSRKSTDAREQAMRLLDSGDAFRCFGNWVRSYACTRRAGRLARVRRSGDAFVQARIAMKKLLLLQDLARLLPGGKHIVKRLGARFVRSGAPAALESGEWLAFQQFMLISERWAIPTSAFAHSGNYEPPPAKYGYRHLGLKVGELLSLLDDTRQSSASVTYPDLLEALQTAIRLGSHPTAWKIAARMAARFPQCSRRYRKVHKHHLNRCEYSGILRWTYGRAK